MGKNLCHSRWICKFSNLIHIKCVHDRNAVAVLPAIQVVPEDLYLLNHP